MEALLHIGEPLSAVQFGKVFRGAGEGFRESNVRYHLSHLVEVGILERISGDLYPGEPGGREKFFYFANGQGETRSRSLGLIIVKAS